MSENLPIDEIICTFAFENYKTVKSLHNYHAYTKAYQ